MIKVSDGKLTVWDKFLLFLFSFYIALFLVANTTAGADLIGVINMLRLIIGIVFAVDLAFDIVARRRNVSFAMIVLFVMALVVFLVTRNKSLLIFTLFIFEFSKFRFSDIVKCYVFTMFSGIMLVVLFSLAGVLENTRFTRGAEVVRYGLGFGWTTFGPEMFTFACLGWLYLRKNKISYYELLGMLVTGVLFYIFTDTRMAFFVLLLIVCAGLFTKLFGRIRFYKLCENSFVKNFLIFLPVIIVAVFGILTLYYSFDLPLADKINSIFSDRLRLTERAFNEIGVKVFGSDFKWNGWNQETFGIVGYDYFYVDNSYFKILFDYGLFFFVFIIVVYVLTIRDALKKRDYHLLFAVIVTTIYAAIVPYLIVLESNAIIFALAPIICGKSVFAPSTERNGLQKGDVSDKSVVAVVVTFNRKILLRESLLALLKSNYENLKMVVVDNASTDGTYDFVKDIIFKNPDKIKYFNTGENVGGAGGFNFGIKKALEMNADYIWLMDDDCIVEENSLSELANAARNLNDDFGFLSSKVLWEDGSLSAMNVQRRGFSDKKFDCNRTRQKIRLASFVSLFLNSKAVEMVGLPYKDFFIWGDDWEYTYRLSETFNCYYIAESVVHHKSNVNVGVDISCETDDRLKRYFYYYRNEGYFYRKSGLMGFLYYLLKVDYHIFKVLFSKCKSKKQRLKILFKGFFASWRFNPKTEYAFKADTEIKVLEFFGEPISYGGQESVVKNLYKNSAWENIKFIFCTPFFCNNTDFINFAEKREDDIIANGKKFDSKFRKLSIICTAKNVFSDEKYDVAHIHAGSVFSLAVIVRAAKRAGVKKVVVHAHSGGINKLSYRIMKKFSDLLLKKYADVYMCCSEIAASWKFPKQIVDKKQYLFLKNGVNTDKFTFDEKIRREYRGNLLIEEMPIICQVARFTEEKNHTFTLKILKALSDRNMPFKALIIGDGPLKSDFEKGVGLLGLQDKIIYFEQRDDIPQMLCASDVFILPSLYEGLPVAAVESQTTGLITLISDKIAPETKVIDLAHFLPIDSKTDADVWASAIINSQKVNRKLFAQQVREAGFDIRDSAIYLEKVYRGYNR